MIRGWVVLESCHVDLFKLTTVGMTHGKPLTIEASCQTSDSRHQPPYSQDNINYSFVILYQSYSIFNLYLFLPLPRSMVVYRSKTGPGIKIVESRRPKIGSVRSDPGTRSDRKVRSKSGPDLIEPVAHFF